MSPNLYNKFDRPLCLEFRPSRILQLSIGLTHLAALVSLMLASLQSVALAALAILVIANALYLYACYTSMAMPASIRKLGWSPAQGWRLPQRDGESLPLSLREPLFVSRHLLVARFASHRYRHHSLLVVADSLNADDFRRLRVRLLQCANGDK